MRYILLLLLAGCVSAEERNQRYAEAIYNQCEAYGFKKGTADFSKCVMQTDLANRQAWQAQEIERQRQYNDIVFGR